MRCIRLLVSVLLFTTSVFTASAFAAQITVYPECGFQGVPVTLDDGDYSQRDLRRAGIADNTISSIVVPEGTQVRSYSNDRFRGSQVAIDSVVACLDSVGFNDTISSLSISSTPVGGLAEPIAGITVYSECNYRGRSATLIPGEYAALSLSRAGLADNSISSIKVPDGFEIQLFENDFYRGRSGTLAANSDCLVERFNNVVSSVIVSGEAVATEPVVVSQAANVPPVQLYSACRYSGNTVKLQPGEYNSADLTRLGFADNSLASMQIPAGLSVTVYEHDFQRGASAAADVDTPCLDGSRYANTVSSVVVKVVDEALVQRSVVATQRTQAAAGVQLFASCDYSGRSITLKAGEYMAADLERAGLPDNTLSSIQVPAGYAITIFENDFMRGGKLRLIENESCLDNRNAGNVVSSVLVEYDNSVAPSLPAAMTAAEQAQLDTALVCVKEYVDRNMCSSDAWNLISQFCQLEQTALMNDGYLEGHVKAGNCTSRNWPELTRRIQDTSLR